ncbi:MAG TPA: radical SAM protein [Gemmatimonadales bacterium]|nr:radical SAM protein [Gemmatimonadales bacterium]
MSRPSLWQILREPVRADTRANLARSRARVPEALRTPRQMLGRGGNGCGATIGAMPRCDFACKGCYLGEGANTVPPEPVEAIKAQMRALRPSLGHAGNLQLTDGEVTLRPVEEVIELLRYARSLDLIPMLMTHGDSFRRRPGLLELLMLEGGLTEVSIHVDTTQRGRQGERWRKATTEEALNPLRDEFAEMIREAKRATGLPLRVATTMTVTADNLAGVPDVIRWLVRNTDAVRMISFQPIAQVGRTLPGLGGGVSVEALWEKVAQGFVRYGEEGSARILDGQVWVGDPRCTRYLPALVARQPGQSPTWRPLRLEGDAIDRNAYDGFLDRFGGVSFRLDTPREALARALALFVRAPGWVLRSLPGWLAAWARRLDAAHPWRFAGRILAGTAQVHGITVISHHFMSEAQVGTQEWRERTDLCVFNVPINGELVPMCTVNATPVRAEYYAQLEVRGKRKAESGGRKAVV